MPLLIRLHSLVVAPSIWLDRSEWEYRFKENPQALMTLLNEGADAVVQDVGGMEALIRSIHWRETTETARTCTRCGVVKPLPEFFPCGKGHVRGECRRCTSTVTREKTLTARPGEE